MYKITILKQIIVFIFFVFLSEGLNAQVQNCKITSPDKQIEIVISTNGQISYSLNVKGQPVLKPSIIGLQLNGNRLLGENAQLLNSTSKEIREMVKPLVYKKSVIQNNYNELRLNFDGNYDLCFRVYNTGFGFRWETSIKDSITIINEVFEIAFPNVPKAWMQLAHTFGSFEYPYIYKSIAALNDFSFKYNDNVKTLLPTVFDLNEIKLAFTIADQRNYPSTFLTYDCNNPNKVRATYQKYVTKDEIGGYKFYSTIAKEYAEYIAITEGTRTYPWRVFVLAQSDKELMNNDLVYLLAQDADPKMDFSWVKPGKVLWDWWYDYTLSNVDFESGMGNDFYKYIIDFASKHKIQYINVDDGWSDPNDLFRLSPKIDVPAIIKYAHERNVGVFLWCTVKSLNKNFEKAMDLFQQWGTDGLKVDFFERDDQTMIANYEKFSLATAKRKMLLNVHGSTIPSGLMRTYPNLISYEAVRGMEYNKGDEIGTTPDLAATLPFSRMLAGSFDYTPGAMRNATSSQYHPVGDNPMSNGTRCQQLAIYIVFDMYLSMLNDRPLDYESEPEILDYLSKVPTSWDETLPIDGKIGEFAVMARKKGNKWYVGALTNTQERTIKIDFSFLTDGQYKAKIFQDGINANRLATDYKILIKEVDKNTKLDVLLKQGGGCAIVVEKQ